MKHHALTIAVLAATSFSCFAAPQLRSQTETSVENPIAVWTPSVTPSGLTRYRGTVYPAWDGDFFVGYLSGKGLERLRVTANRAVLRETMLSDMNERLRDVRTGPDRRIYILTDNENGRLLRLNPGAPSAAERSRVAQRYEPNLSSAAQTAQNRSAVQTADEVKAGKSAFIERCSGCHRVGTVVKGGESGPDLSGVYGRKAGSMAGFAYWQGAGAPFSQTSSSSAQSPA